ncbi:hypothetical protein ACHAXT_004455 [Thalassiosira profunda]
MGDLPSDEEASASYRHLHEEENDDEETETMEEDPEEEEYIGEVEGASPPPPPPPPPRNNRSRAADRQRRAEALPTTIEVAAPRSRIASRAQQKVHNATHHPTHSYDSNAYSESSAGAGREGGRSKPNNYESFPAPAELAPSVNNSLLESSVDQESLPKSLEEAPLPLPAKKAARGQVLVHYHPQLGDEGYESTLLDAASEDKYSRVGRAMNVATDRRAPDRPPKHIYPTNRGMHTRAIDEAREEEINKSRNRMQMGGNDEYNNAATRQIRRRVFRVALERGMHDERRKKLLDADMDVGGPGTRAANGDAGVSPSGLALPGSSLGRNGFRFPSRSGDSVSENEGDLPLSPKSPGTPAVDDTSVEQSLTSPPAPPPPSQPPSYRTLVHNLIAANEPEKLAQIDRVMEKYVGREEELIKKLDLRYRRRRAKREKILDDLRTVEQTRSKEGVEPVADEAPKEEKAGEKEEEKVKPLDHKQIEEMTSPGRIEFIKVEPTLSKDQSEGVATPERNGSIKAESPKERSAIMAMQSWDRSEGEGKISPPPDIRKKALPTAISDSTKTDVLGNRGGDDDDNSGFIGIPKVAKAEVENLGNQVMKERLLRGQQKEEQILKATGSPKERGEKKLPGSPNVHEDYKLKPTQSFGDGISVITMETKATMQRAAAGRPVTGDGEAVYGFDEMKRPPNSITVEDNSGSGKQEPHEGAFPKLQKVVPEMETLEEKEQAAEASAAMTAKMDDVEARIDAQRQLREEEEAQKSPGGALMMADDELGDEAKEVETVDATMKTVEVDDKNEGAAANPVMIESILSSFDEEDKTPKGVEHFRKQYLTPIDDTDDAGGEDNRTVSTIGSKAQLDEEVARLLAEKESRLQAEKAVALMKAQRELEAEKRARLEAEAARLKAERELEQLKVGKTAEDEQSHDEGASEEGIEEESQPQAPKQESDDDNDAAGAEFARLKAEQELERLRLEKMAGEAEAARIKAEEELETLRKERATKEAEASELVEAVLQSSNTSRAFDEVTDVPSLDQGRERKASADVAETARLEAEATRIKAEQELEKLKQTRAAAAREDEEAEGDLERMNSEQDEVENFRRRYSSEGEEDVPKGGEDAVNDNIQQEPPAEEASATPDVESEKEIAPTDDEVGGAEADEAEKDKEAPEASALALAPVSAAQVQTSENEDAEPKSSPDSLPPTQEQGEEDGEANIHHIARVTFEGDQSKGQLSFTTGSKVEAHSNQRGPWWLGRCGGRTGWFPANAVVPASEFLGSVVSSPVDDVATDREEELAQLSGDELNKVYDLIRNPSDPERDDEDDDSDSESSPAKMRWLGGGNTSKATSNARDPSPPPSRSDPSEMAGLTQRLYGSDDDRSRSDDEIARMSQSPLLVVKKEIEPTEAAAVDEAPTSEESPLAQPSEAQPAETSKDEPEVTSTPPPSTADAAIKDSQSPKKVNAGLDASSPKKASYRQPKPTPGWRAVKDPKSGLVYYYHTETKETTWKRPKGYKSKKPAAKGTPRSADSGESKGKSKGIMGLGFLAKRKKTKPEAGTSPRVETSRTVSPEAKAAAKKDEVVDATAAAKEEKSDYPPKEDKPQDQAQEKEEATDEPEAESPIASEPPQKETVHIKPDRDEEYVALAGAGYKLNEIEEPERTEWKTMDETSSASDESDNSDDSSETSLFSKTKNAFGAVGDLAGMIAERLTSPNRPYETLDEGPEQPRDPSEVVSENAAKPVEEEPTQVQEETTKPLQLEPATRKAVAGVEKRARDDAKRKKTEWRSAIDGASGRTYYYKKGSQAMYKGDL